MTTRNQVASVDVGDGEAVDVTLIVAFNPYFPNRLCYDVYLPNGEPAGRVSKVTRDRVASTGRWANRTVTRTLWQATTARGYTLVAHPTRAAALRSLIRTLRA